MLPPQLIPTLIPARIGCLFHCRLKMLEDALLTLKPTSVESERIFSNVGRIATKFETKFGSFLSRNVSTLTYLKNFTGQRDGTGFPGNDKNLSRDRRSGNPGKLQSLLILPYLKLT